MKAALASTASSTWPLSSSHWAKFAHFSSVCQPTGSPSVHSGRNHLDARAFDVFIYACRGRTEENLYGFVRVVGGVGVAPGYSPHEPLHYPWVVLQHILAGYQHQLVVVGHAELLQAHNVDRVPLVFHQDGLVAEVAPDAGIHPIIYQGLGKVEANVDQLHGVQACLNSVKT